MVYLKKNLFPIFCETLCPALLFSILFTYLVRHNLYDLIIFRVMDDVYLYLHGYPLSYEYEISYSFLPSVYLKYFCKYFISESSK
jgi:hypothetical protein